MKIPSLKISPVSLSKTISFFKGVVFAFGLCVGVGAVLAAPPGSPPNCPNTSAACNPPIHTGIANVLQTINAGGLWVNSLGATSLVVGTAPTTVGQVLSAINTTGGVGWRDVNAVTSGLIIKTGKFAMTPCSNTNGCVKDFTFPSPFPTGAQTVYVTAQPMWTRDNGGEHSTWRVNNVTYGGFTFAMTQPTSGTNNGVGAVMWSAYFDPTEYNAATLSTASCKATYSNGAIDWSISVPDGYREIAIASVSDPNYYYASGLQVPIIDYAFSHQNVSFLNPVPHGNYSKSFLVKDFKEVFQTVTCSVVLP